MNSLFKIGMHISKRTKVRARKALMEISKLAKERRKELRDVDTPDEEV